MFAPLSASSGASGMFRRRPDESTSAAGAESIETEHFSPRSTTTPYVPEVKCRVSAAAVMSLGRQGRCLSGTGPLMTKFTVEATVNIRAGIAPGWPAPSEEVRLVDGWARPRPAPDPWLSVMTSAGINAATVVMAEIAMYNVARRRRDAPAPASSPSRMPGASAWRSCNVDRMRSSRSGTTLTSNGDCPAWAETLTQRVQCSGRLRTHRRRGTPTSDGDLLIAPALQVAQRNDRALPLRQASNQSPRGVPSIHVVEHVGHLTIGQVADHNFAC